MTLEQNDEMIDSISGRIAVCPQCGFFRILDDPYYKRYEPHQIVCPQCGIYCVSRAEWKRFFSPKTFIWIDGIKIRPEQIDTVECFIEGCGWSGKPVRGVKLGLQSCPECGGLLKVTIWKHSDGRLIYGKTDYTAKERLFAEQRAQGIVVQKPTPEAQKVDLTGTRDFLKNARTQEEKTAVRIARTSHWEKMHEPVVETPRFKVTPKIVPQTTIPAPLKEGAGSATLPTNREVDHTKIRRIKNGKIVGGEGDSEAEDESD